MPVSGVSRDRSEREWMMGENKIGPFPDRLGRHLGREGEAGEHPGDGPTAGSDEQADRVPLGGQPQRGDAF